MDTPPLSYAVYHDHYGSDDWSSVYEGTEPLLNSDSDDSGISAISDYTLISDGDDDKSIQGQDPAKEHGEDYLSSEYSESPPPIAQVKKMNPGVQPHDDGPHVQDKKETNEAMKEEVVLETEDEKEEKVEEKRNGEENEKKDERDEKDRQEQGVKGFKAMGDPKAHEKGASRGYGKDVSAFKCIKIACNGSCSKHCPTPNLVSTAAQDRLYDVYAHIESTLAETGQGKLT